MERETPEKSGEPTPHCLNNAAAVAVEEHQADEARPEVNAAATGSSSAASAPGTYPVRDTQTCEEKSVKRFKADYRQSPRSCRTKRSVRPVMSHKAKRSMKISQSTSVGVMPNRTIKHNELFLKHHRRDTSHPGTSNSRLKTKDQPHALSPLAQPGECSSNSSEIPGMGPRDLLQFSNNQYSRRKIEAARKASDFHLVEIDSKENSLHHRNRTASSCQRSAEKLAGSLNEEHDNPTLENFSVTVENNSEGCSEIDGLVTVLVHKTGSERGKKRYRSSSPPPKPSPTVCGKEALGYIQEVRFKRLKEISSSNIQKSNHPTSLATRAGRHLPRQPQAARAEPSHISVNSPTPPSAHARLSSSMMFDARDVMRGNSLHLPHLSIMLAVPLVCVGIIFFSESLAMNDWFTGTYEDKVEVVGLWTYCVNRTCTTFSEDRTHFAWPLWQSRLAMGMAFLIAIPAIGMSAKDLHDYWFKWRSLAYVDEAMQFLLLALLFLFFAMLFVTFTEIKRFSVKKALSVDPGFGYVLAFAGLLTIMAATVSLQCSYVCCRLDRRCNRLVPMW